jgi:integrase
METKISFWEEYQKRIKKKVPPLQHCEKILENSSNKLTQAISTFRNELAMIPIGAEIEHWLHQENLQRQALQYETYMLHLIDIGLLRITQDNGEVRSLNDINTEEHQWIIENIRCIPMLNIAEKEKTVEAYILFSQHLSRITCGLIMQGEDPDFQRTIKKVVLYKKFIQFVQLLPERDALIAKLLYFGAPTVEETLNLKVKQIEENEHLVKFKKLSVKYPKHIISELKNFTKDKKQNDLIFINIKGEKVERTHLNNCFNRACSKFPKKERITPKMLLASDIANSVALYWPYSRLSIQ